MSLIHLCLDEYEMRTMTNTLGLAPLRKLLNYRVGDPLFLRTLREDSHSLREITLRALRYFDRPFFWWNNEQKRSFYALHAFFAQPAVREDFESLYTEDIEYCMENIGNIFFLGGLDEVRCGWLNFEQGKEEPDLLGLTQPGGDGQEVIAINKESREWKKRAVEERWELAREILLHEACHVVFLRFMIRQWDLAAPGEGGKELPNHHAAWQVLAKAVEDRIFSEFGWKVNIGRHNGLSEDWLQSRYLGMTWKEIKHYFGDRVDCTGDQFYSKYTGFRWKFELVYREGTSYFFARVRTEISKTFAKFYAKIRGREPEPEEDVFEEYLWRLAKWQASDGIFEEESPKTLAAAVLSVS